jgi:F-type H+-transporting ATPase subunit b
MKKILFTLLCLSPLALFANEHGGTDILQRTINFFIFAAIMYYLLADKAKEYFANRTSSIQAELDKVQDMLKQSKAEVDNAKKELDDAKVLANEIIELAKNDQDKIKTSILESVENEIKHLQSSFDNKLSSETKKITRDVVEEVLEELLKSDNMELSQNDLAEIVLKKVA